jgi:hypothetical protein
MYWMRTEAHAQTISSSPASVDPKTASEDYTRGIVDDLAGRPIRETVVVGLFSALVICGSILGRWPASGFS